MYMYIYTPINASVFFHVYSYHFIMTVMSDWECLINEPSIIDAINDWCIMSEKISNMKFLCYCLICISMSCKTEESFITINLLCIFSPIDNNNNNNNNSKFLYALFPWGPKRLQRIITPVIGYISMPHLQCTISTPQGAFLAWYSNL